MKRTELKDVDLTHSNVSQIDIDLTYSNEE